LLVTTFIVWYQFKITNKHNNHGIRDGKVTSMDSVNSSRLELLKHCIASAPHTDSIEPFNRSTSRLELTKFMDVTLSSRIPWLVCVGGQGGWLCWEIFRPLLLRWLVEKEDFCRLLSPLV
jgi:hypothetical protein